MLYLIPVGLYLENTSSWSLWEEGYWRRGCFFGGWKNLKNVKRKTVKMFKKKEERGKRKRD
jgi:hypothetical protein